MYSICFCIENDLTSIILSLEVGGVESPENLIGSCTSDPEAGALASMSPPGLGLRLGLVSLSEFSCIPMGSSEANEFSSEAHAFQCFYMDFANLGAGPPGAVCCRWSSGAVCRPLPNLPISLWLVLSVYYKTR